MECFQLWREREGEPVKILKYRKHRVREMTDFMSHYILPHSYDVSVKGNVNFIVRLSDICKWPVLFMSVLTVVVSNENISPS